MSTQAYYKERLGFDPADTVAEHHREQRSQHGYEESLSKFKDERDAIQKKTFTKWVNKHLKKASRHVGDLFEDLRDGYNLISLLEVLSGEHLPRERGRMRFHMLQNVQMALDFLRYKKIKLVNIRAEDIVDGNPKLTLGLIWTIILHFQISDIVVGQEPNVTAREALLRWARRSTARYPGVRVTDFTGSWRDGLAFSALIHRNRPDLVDWRNARASQPRERLDRVFNVAEREYGVTRLLDPEDVDTPEPDEKSLITYISSLYDVFPEPPPIHPLYDAEAQRRSEEYRELASSLHLWIREKMCLMQERAFPPTLIEMKKLAADSTKFKNEEVPPRYRDKQRLSYLFRDLQKYFEAVGEVDIEAELHIEVIEKNWNRLMMLHQEREQAIVDEIKRLERLQRLAEKVHREMKSTDNRLEELERRVEDEARRLDRLHPLEAKHAVDLLEQDIRNTEIQIQNIFTDVHTLTEGRYSQAAELHKRVQKLHQRWVALRSLLHKRLVQPLSAVSFPVEERVVTKHRTTVHETRLVDTNPHFRSLHDCIDWCKAKIKQLQDADYGSDLPSVQNELDVHQKEHKNIEQFHPKVDRCVQAKSHFHGEESTLYSQHLAVLQKLYTELLAASNKRLSDLDTLLDFIQSATGELVWLSSKEETEVTRDWSDKNLNVQSIEQYYESLMSDLEKREIQFSAVQDRGEALVLQHHPAAKTIEAYMSAMQSQWAWLLQLTLCLEVHLKHAAQSQQFFRDVQQAEQWISKRDETLNTIYSQSDFSLDEGERLLKGMQELREELNGYGDHVQKLVDQAKDVVPMKQRRQPVTRPMQVSCVCSYKQVNMSIEKGEQCTLYDNSGRIKWRVKNQEGVETPVPGVCFALQPPDKDALEAAERLRRQYDRSIALWQRKQLRLRQNMIFATIKVVKGWDLPQFLAMGQDQRTAIRKALNEDAEKLLSEGDPADPQLRRLKREMAEVNKLFDELEKRARAEEESKNAGRIFNEQISALQQSLEEAERALSCRVAAPLPRDTDSLEHLVLQHKDLEQSLRRLAPDLDRVQQTFRGITLKTPAMRNKLDAVTTKWTQIWNSSNLYVERLKCVEIVLSRLEENTAAISELEVKLASFDELPSDIKGLQNVLEDLMVLQNAIAQQQAAMDQLNEDAHNARRLVEKSRSAHRGPHSDVDRLDDEVNRLNSRWTNICGQLVDRLRSAETAYALAQQLEHAYRNEVDFVDESYNRLEMENAKNLLNRAVERAPAIEAVNVTGGRLIREGKQAVEEKYKLCDETSAKLLKWISEVEEQLANQENAKEDIEELRNQITAMNKIKVDLEAHSRPVSSCLDQIRQVVLTGGNVLSSEEVSTLEKNGRSLKTRFDKASDRTERMVKRLNAARDELVKFKNELSTFSHWLEGARRILEKKEHSLSDLNRLHASTDSTRDFISDVIAHQADLRFITMAAQKFVDEGKEFLHALNEFRAGLPQPLPAKESTPCEASAVRGEVSLVSSRYKDLLARANLLSDKLSGVGGRQRDYRECVEKARGWLREMEPKVNRAVSEATAAEPKQVEEQLARVKALNKEMLANERLVESVRSSLEALLRSLDLVNAGGEQVDDASHLRDEADELAQRANDLRSRLEERYNRLESAATAVGQFYERAKAIGQQVAVVEKELDSMRASSREVKALRAQMEEAGKAMGRVGRLYEEVSSLERLGERLVDYGVSAECAAVGDQVEQLKRQVGRLDERSRDRHHELSATLDKLQEFHRAHGSVMAGIEEASERVRRLKPVGSEVESIKAQQEDFRLLKGERIEPLARSVDDCNGAGQALIQTAGRDVSTANIERDLDRMNERWNELKEKLNERDRRLDVGLLQSGKFQEALDGLQKWLADTEEMVSNQKPPSSDYKVIKAQLQGQKFLKKMLMDRQNSMSSLYNMGQEVAGGADPKERKTIEKQLKELVGRFDNLTESAAERMEALEQAMGVAKQFQDKLVPLSIWLDKTEKRVRDMELVPTDEEKIQQRVAEHDALHEDILSRKPDFSELTEIASQLMALVGEDEAAALADKLQDAADRYAALVERSEALGGLLQRSRQGLRHLVLSYQELQAWMEGMEIRLAKYRVLAVHTEKLLQQMEDLADLTEEVSSRQTEVDSTTDAGLELMKHISSDEALQLKDKLDSLQRRFNDLVSRGSDLLKHAQESLPLVQQFHDNHNRLMDWMQGAESALQSAEPREDEIVRLEMEISEYRPVLDKINAVGPQLAQLSPGEGAATVEALVTRDNRRFDAIAEQIQRKAERIQLSKQRSLEVIGDIDDLLEWFREVDNQLREAEPPSSEPEIIRVQLKEHKALNDDISSQKGRVRDVISTAKKVIRENSRHEDTSTIRENMEDLRETMEIVSGLSADRLGALEQALPLAEHLRDTHVGLVSWLEEAEQQVAMLPMPALRPDLIVAQQDKNELLVQSINEHKPLVEKLNKTGEALIKLCNEEEGMKIQDILEADTARYAALRAELRSRQQTLEQALQESSQFSDKLEGMLRALSSTADQVNGAEPISAHPGRLRDQMEENSALIDELAQRSEAYAAVKRAADDVISKAGNRADPAVKDIKRKLEKLNKLWADVQKSTTDRSHTLDDALQIAEKFWSELNGVMSTLRELQDALAGQAPPAAQPATIQQQQVALQEIRHEIDQTKPDVEQVRASGHELMGLCGEPDKPEVRKHIEDLDQAWDNVTALYARREENLIDAMEKAMEFHETLQNLLEFLEEAEEKFARMGPLGSDIDEVKKQIKQLANFKAEVDPHMVKVEALNRQAAELTERTSSEQAAAIKEPLGAVNKRWDGLLRGLVERQRLLENALLRLGQFQHALDELLVWIEKTDDTLDNLKAVAGDPQVIEVELAKLKVLVNDIQAHQTSVDTLNDAGRQLIEDGKGTAEASTTAEKLGTLNRRWRDLLQRAADRQRELEDALREAQSFTAEIQDLLSWLGDVDNTIVASKPVGGLPETATEQLERFMEVYNELEQSRGKVETVLQQGQEYLKRADSSSAGGLSHNLKTLKQRWDNVTARANDKKIKLEIALREATEFHDALQVFVDWLTNAEKILMNLKPVSRVMETILGQIEEHKAFQKDVGTHRETMLNLDKKGTHLKYFSQKQDVILIKNLLISVQHRWERVVSKSAERTRALDHGYKEAREFHDAWSGLMNWLDETERILDEVAGEGAGLGGNDPEKIKARLNKHRELQKALSAKQGAYDTAMKNGKSLKDKAPKSDELALKELLNELKNKWTTVCGKCVDRQRKLEEALLFSGQFKDAVQALLEWLVKSEKQLANTGPLFGDLDTVMNLVEQHKTFEKDLESRATQMESVIRTGRELLDKATQDDAAAIGSQLAELNDLWDTVTRLSSDKTGRLEAALREAERLHKAVHVLLEWLSDAEMKLRFAGQLPEDEQESRNQLMEHEKFLRELRAKEVEKEQTLELAHTILAKAHPDGALVIKHWITIIQSRWEEVSTWAQQRNQRLENHMRGLQDLDNLLEELLSWLEGLENTLNTLEAEPLPDDKATLEMLIGEHREFMESTSRRQDEVDRVCKARQIKSAKDTKKITKAKSPAPTRASPGRERTPDSLPHIGPRFPPKGSKGAEPEFRSPRVKLLWDRWRHVWMLAWERQRRLQDKYNYIQELDRVANFSWEDWRKRFLKFMNHKKSRLTDLFRKMDKNNDGLIPREDFIQGIMNTKFETSRLEMGAVADLFDQHGEGLIDWKEFIAALRPDWEERRTYNDTDKIHDEVKRLVMLCTCRQKFRVFQVGEGKYRFGDSQKLRLVRILRSTVMVRVGGGWVALDEFLLKNDPCRAKGRTNIELREQFILADGVSQTMTAFRSKPSPTSTLQRTHISSASAGPITKVRERSARSVPMGQSRASRSSLSAGTPDSLSDNESSFKIASARKSSTPYRSTMTPGGSRPSSRPASRPASRPTSRPGSRPASRQGSKPPSRYGSTQSLDSTDESTNVSRIPRRTAVSTTGNTPTSSRHNSVSGKRLGTPVNGSSSRPRTPTGLVSPASGVPSRFGTIHRASSIPTLTGVGTPIRTRTPSSGSSTPLPPSLKLSRKPSGASDTSVSTTTTTTPASHRKGKPTPVDQRAPFRL